MHELLLRYTLGFMSEKVMRPQQDIK